MELWTLIGYIAALCGAVSLIPEVIKGYRTHHLEDVSWAMLGLLTTSGFLWGLYGIHIGDVPLTLSSGVNFMMEISLIVMKKHYEITGKPLIQFFKKKEKPEELEPGLETELTEKN